MRLSIFAVTTRCAAPTSRCSSSPRACSRCSSSTRCTSSGAGLLAARGGLRVRSVHARSDRRRGLSQKLVPALGARDVPLIGLALAVVGLLCFLRLTPDSSYVTDLLPAIALTALGMGLVFVPITLIATSGHRRPTTLVSHRVCSTRRSRSAGRSASRSSRRSRRARPPTRSPRSAGRRPRRSSRRRSWTGSTSRGSAARCSSRSAPCSSSPFSGVATWSRSAEGEVAPAAATA